MAGGVLFQKIFERIAAEMVENASKYPSQWAFTSGRRAQNASSERNVQLRNLLIIKTCICIIIYPEVLYAWRKLGSLPGSVEVWKCGSLEVWKFGSLEVWKTLEA